MKDFRELKVWEKAHNLALTVYRTTESFPQTEMYGLTSQLRRSASSIPTNIAEGCGRGSDKDFARFLQVAMGSASEVEYHIIFCRDLKLIGDDLYANLNSNVIEVKKMLASLIKKLKAHN